jgi:hypothetical protein
VAVAAGAAHLRATLVDGYGKRSADARRLACDAAFGQSASYGSRDFYKRGILARLRHHFDGMGL